LLRGHRGKSEIPWPTSVDSFLEKASCCALHGEKENLTQNAKRKGIANGRKTQRFCGICSSRIVVVSGSLGCFYAFHFKPNGFILNQSSVEFC